MYHYVRDLPKTQFPRIKGMLTDDFRAQVEDLSARHEMATLESALEFLSGDYQPKRDLCLLTFDDGLADHYETAAPILAEKGIQGLFFLITGCLAERRVAPVHMNHFLMAALPFEEYRARFLERLTERTGDTAGDAKIDAATAERTYPLDEPGVARFKYLFNFKLDAEARDAIVGELFTETLGDEGAFADQLYLSWEQGRRMQDAGMALGGHTHRHRPLSALARAELEDDLAQCRKLLLDNVGPQTVWPFSYPYGKRDSFTPAAIERLKAEGYDCSFTTEKGDNHPGVDPFLIRRVDCKKAS
jgi:peptidoglycan/xylan/chitin deacetylase (PgdA/CDA1 family)